MTVHTVSMSTVAGLFHYPPTITTSQNIQIADTVSLTMTIGTNNATEAGYLTTAYAVFTLDNCTVSPSSNVVSGDTITVTPTNNNALYGCQALFTHYHPNPTGGPTSTSQTKTFILNGAVGTPPVYGLEIFDGSGNSRLKYDNRLCKFHSVFTGTLSGSSTTLTVTGMAADGTWGVSNQTQTSIVKAAIVSNGIYLEETDFGSGGNLYGSNKDYEIIVFRI